MCSKFVCWLFSSDTERALQVMEACQAGAAEGVKGRTDKLLNIFQSDLFQALLGNTHTQCYIYINLRSLAVGL
uniref:L27-1 domain-containing protein n=1 Tax=Anabas testudineus TaxID=64144 RepID=A0A7N6AL05_ANATE